MLKLINIKKLTAKTLLGILATGCLFTQASTKTASAGQCDNNGHGNNGDIVIEFFGKEFLLTKFDPSNPGNGTKIERELEESNPGITEGEINSLKALILNGDYDYERKPKSGNDSDCDGINDEVEVGSNFNNPVDTDGDGDPDFIDLDSDNDGYRDYDEGTGDADGDNIPDYLDTVDDSVSSTSTNDSSSSSSAPTSLILTGTIRDFQDSHPDFQYKIGNDRGLVTTTLGADKKPVYAHGSEGTKTTNGPEYFNQWYRNVPGVNKSKEHSIELTLQDDGTYKYQNNSFFPINGELWGNYRNNRNYHFTYELHTKFTYRGGEVFTFSGDDDVFVYIDGQRVIDIGGVHTSQTDSVNLDSLGLTVGETYELAFFFAERHYSQSNFTITTNIELETAADPNADDDNDGISNIAEGSEQDTPPDSDNDGTPDYEDTDSDNNGVPDSTEVGIPASPSDSDADGTPNYQDTDDDGNGILDVDEIGNNVDNPTNTDGTDLPDYQDTDDDNDGILDVDEIGSDPSNPTNTDGDNVPDYQDTDSDNDGISDVVEGGDDFDGDNTPNYQDEDSDNDTIPDSEETGNDSPLDDDSDPNFIDLDSDGDGIPDKNEENADSNDPGDEPDVEDGDLSGDESEDNVDGKDDGDNYLDRDSDDDGLEDDVDPEPYIPTYAD